MRGFSGFGGRGGGWGVPPGNYDDLETMPRCVTKEDREGVQRVIIETYRTRERLDEAIKKYSAFSAHVYLCRRGCGVDKLCENGTKLFQDVENAIATMKSS